jgi:hypothetical protein
MNLLKKVFKKFYTQKSTKYKQQNEVFFYDPEHVKVDALVMGQTKGAWVVNGFFSYIQKEELQA